MRLRLLNLCHLLTDQWATSRQKMQRWRRSGTWKRSFCLGGLLLPAEVRCCCFVNYIIGFCFFKDPNPLLQVRKTPPSFKPDMLDRTDSSSMHCKGRNSNEKVHLECVEISPRNGVPLGWGTVLDLVAGHIRKNRWISTDPDLDIRERRKVPFLNACHYYMQIGLFLYTSSTKSSA